MALEEVQHEDSHQPRVQMRGWQRIRQTNDTRLDVLIDRSLACLVAGQMAANQTGNFAKDRSIYDDAEPNRMTPNCLTIEHLPNSIEHDRRCSVAGGLKA
jgi:hypothetical protein